MHEGYLHHCMPTAILPVCTPPPPPPSSPTACISPAAASHTPRPAHTWQDMSIPGHHLPWLTHSLFCPRSHSPLPTAPQVAADANSALQTYPDQSLYPVDSVPKVRESKGRAPNAPAPYCVNRRLASPSTSTDRLFDAAHWCNTLCRHAAVVQPLTYPSMRAVCLNQPPVPPPPCCVPPPKSPKTGGGAHQQRF